jgi:uncharacterized membrane protein YqjE
VSVSSSPPPGEQRSKQPPEQPQNIATMLTEVSERATLLIHEEIELAKAEVAEKTASLMRGAVVAATAGIFLVMALVLFLVGCAWLLYFYLPGSTFAYFWGFFAMTVILVVLGAVVGLVAARVMRKAAPPVPSMAIDEARKIRDTVSGEDASGPAAGGVPVPPPAPTGLASASGDGGETRS